MEPAVLTAPEPAVVRLRDLHAAAVAAALGCRGVVLVEVADGEEIPASYWGEGEAGVIGNRVYARGDTPLQSILHTAAHVMCMSEERRAVLHRDCGSDDAEEEAVCYLQLLLADGIAGYDRQQLMADMDAWGYHFRLGSTRAWFEHDADDARRWLIAHGVLT